MTRVGGRLAGSGRHGASSVFGGMGMAARDVAARAPRGPLRGGVRVRRGGTPAGWREGGGTRVRF